MVSMDDDILQKMRSKINFCRDYENESNYEMAYISVWSAFELLLKFIAKEIERNLLKEQLTSWLKYIDKITEIAPQPIKHFPKARHYENLPGIGFFAKYYPGLTRCEIVLNSQGKFRRRRNEIAHEATRFKSKELYFEYKEMIIGALNEALSVTVKNNNFQL